LLGLHDSQHQGHFYWLPAWILTLFISWSHHHA